jgi:LacI family transcriptional regulator
MTPTRNDVARAAGVSPATVSYVINNGPRPVASETRERVLEAVRKLDYQPSAVARNLRLQRTSNLGLLVPDTHNPYFSEVARGIERVAFENKYNVMLCHSGYDPAREMQYVNMLRFQRAAGVIWMPATENMQPFQKLKEYGIPTVILDRTIPQQQACTVTADNHQGGLLATEHLLSLGHRRVGFITRRVDLSHSQDRFSGYRATLENAGIPYDEPLVVRGGVRLEDGRAALHKLMDLPEPPTAVFAYNDTTAIGVLRGLHELGIQVPKHFSVVGFDDIAQAAFTCPALTTIDIPKFRLGQRGAKALLELINTTNIEPCPEAPLQVRLVERESTGPPNPSRSRSKRSHF